MKSVIDEEELNKCLQKIELYSKEEKLNFLNIRNSYDQGKTSYQTTNTDGFTSIEEEIKNRFHLIEKNHTYEKMTIIENIEKYNKLTKETEKKFNNILQG